MRVRAPDNQRSTYLTAVKQYEVTRKEKSGLSRPYITDDEGDEICINLSGSDAHLSDPVRSGKMDLSWEVVEEGL